MRLDIFKDQILNNNVTDNLIIFKGTDNSDFIMNQYYNQIAKIKRLEICLIDDLDYRSLENNEYYLFIYKTKLFEDEKLSKIKHLIVITEKVSDDCQWMFNNDIVEFPEISDWMLKDYIHSNVPKLSDQNIEDLFNRCNKNPYRIDNEVFKLKLFDDSNFIYNSYKDTIDNKSSLMFDLTNSLIDKDYSKLGILLARIDKDFNSLGFLALLKSNFKKIIDIQTNSKASYEQLNMTSKQFWYYKYNKCDKYNKKQLLDIYELLTSIDRDLKNGKFQDINIFDYLIEKIYIIGNKA